MSSWAQLAIDHLWHNALAAVPLALLVAGVCRWVRCRPTTRHTLWLLVLAWFVVPVALPAIRVPAEAVEPDPDCSPTVTRPVVSKCGPAEATAEAVERDDSFVPAVQVCRSEPAP